MLVAPGLLYLHLPRTGGTFVTNLLEREGVGTRTLTPEVGGHDGIRRIPERVADSSFVFGTVRDPWSWYASIDTHYRHRSHLDGFLLEAFGKRKVSFKESLLGMTKPSSLTFLRGDGAVRYPGARVPVKGLFGILDRAGIGLYTFMMLRMFVREEIETLPGLSRALEQGVEIPWSVDLVIDTAQLRDGLSAVVSAWSSEVGDRLYTKIHQEAPSNQKGNGRGVLATGKPDPAYYDSAMIEAVLERDGPMMRLLGFDQPVGSPLRPAVRMLRG